MELIKNQNITGRIVISDTAAANEEYAARELRYYFNRMTANPVYAKKTAEKLEDAVFVLGSALTLYGEDRETYEDDELHWYTKDGKVFFDGGCRGLLYGVYDFLESLGCRFFAQNAEKIPTYGELTIPDTDRRDKPAITCRHYYYGPTNRDAVFAAKCRNNATTYDAKFGGPYKMANSHHSFYEMVYIDKYFDEHPEWFAMYDGKRGRRRNGGEHSWQLCLSNPEVIDKLIEETRKILKNAPDAKVVCVSQNDCGFSCECDACRKIDEEEGSAAGLVVRMINAVAEALEPEFPNVQFETFAYTYSRFAPKISRPRHNVTIQYCTIESCFAHPIAEEDCGWAAYEKFPSTTGQQIAEWGKLGANMAIWDYLTVFWYYPQPHPNWHVLQPNMQFFHKYGARRMFAQSNSSSGAAVDLDELRCYLVCKLMWDPYCDFKKHLTEFTDFFYGDAAPYIVEYIETLCEKCEKDNNHFNCYGHHDASPFMDYLTPDMVEIYNAILEKAEAAVRDDVVRRMRVQRIRLGLKYIVIRYKNVTEHYHDAEELNKLFEEAAALGVERYEECSDEHGTIQAFAEEKWRGGGCSKF